MTTGPNQFLTGVIEGFYGQPWSEDERFRLFELLSQKRLNTYVYAPKDDLKHRVLWRESYSQSEAEALGRLISRCSTRGLTFVYALGPGLDIRYSSVSDLQTLKSRFAQVADLGCRDFAILFDDIPDCLHAEDRERWRSFASAQACIANTLHQYLRETRNAGRFFFCPTPYCGRMANRLLGGEDYLPILGQELAPDIDIFWTGPEIVSREIPAAHIRDLSIVLRRKPVIWDNLYANDYDGTRFYTGPFLGRSAALKEEVNGILLNPNSEYLLNWVPFTTYAAFATDRRPFDATGTYEDALKEWLPSFATVHGVATLEDLKLFAGCYYLPHEEGPEAERLYLDISRLIAETPVRHSDLLLSCRERMARLRRFCANLAELRDRPLFYSLSRRAWDLREELDLLEAFINARLQSSGPNFSAHSDFHLPGTYRGGMVARLRRLFRQNPDGSIVPTNSDPLPLATQ